MLGLLQLEWKHYRTEKRFRFLHIAYLIVILFLTKAIEKAPYIILGIVFFKNVVLIQTSLHIDENNNWNVYRQSFPIKNEEIILSKYIVVFFKLFLDLIVCLALTFIILNSAVNYLLYFTWFFIYLILFTFMISVFMPVFYKMGFIKSSNINILIILGLSLLVYMYIDRFGFEIDFKSVLYLVLTLISLISLVLSYRLSLKIYKERDL